MSQSQDMNEKITEQTENAKKTAKKTTAVRRTRKPAAEKKNSQDTSENPETVQAKKKPSAKASAGTKAGAEETKTRAKRTASRKTEISADGKENSAAQTEAGEQPETPAPEAKKKTRAAAAGTRRTKSSKTKEADLLDASADDGGVSSAKKRKAVQAEKPEPAAADQPDAGMALSASSADPSPALTEQEDGKTPHGEGSPSSKRKRPARKQVSQLSLFPEGKDGNSGTARSDEADSSGSDHFAGENNPGNKNDERKTAEEAQPAWPDDEKVTSILPVADAADDIRSHKRLKRSRRIQDGQPNFNSAYYQPPYEQHSSSLDRLNAGKRKLRDRRIRRQNPNGVMQAFDADYNAALYDDSILGAAQSKFQESQYVPEDDGPQPVLPDQPQAADFTFPPAEEDYAELDNAVNGNRAKPSPATIRENRLSKRSRKFQKDIRSAKNEQAVPQEKTETPKVRRVLYLSVVPNEQAEVVITEDGQVAEYFVEMAHQVKIRGNIYKGTINNIDTNLQAAFVNFGNGKNGFLQIDEVHPEYYLTPHDETQSGSKYPPIQKALKVGQEVLVQIVKEPAGSKGAFLTTWITIAGRFLVLTPGKEQIGVSRKVTDLEERARLKELLNGIQPGENMGVIIRTASEGADRESIQQDLTFLKKLYEEIKEKASSEKSPALIYQEADLVSRSVRDYLSEDIVEIWTDDEDTRNRVEETVRLIFPGKDIVRLHKDPRHGMWEHFGILKQLESVTSREVLLPSGGRLVFDQTEALMAIDINSGKTQGKTNFESMVFRTNMEAAEAIARHLRLRDIGGQVVIDFIEMRDKNHCTEVERTLRSAMRRDRACHDVGRMSSFGLLELVRQRTGTSAISISTEACPHCHGTGLRRNMEWQALHALRDMEIRLAKIKDGAKIKKSERRYADSSIFTYECSAELALYLLNRKRDRLEILEEKFGMRIEVQIK